MNEGIEVAVVHGVKISYDAEKKMFNARVGGRDIQKSSQREVEKVISKFVKGEGSTKAIILHYGWGVVVHPIEIVGLRGSKIQYKERDRMESESSDRVYLHDETVLAAAKTLQKEYDDWQKRWQALLKKAKPIDIETLK